MLGSLFVPDDDLVVDDKVLSKPKAPVGGVLDAGISALGGLNPEQWDNDHPEEALKTATVKGWDMPDGEGIRPCLAYSPLRAAVTGRQVFPPLFEPIEILGSSSTLARLRALQARFG